MSSIVRSRWLAWPLIAVCTAIATLLAIWRADCQIAVQIPTPPIVTVHIAASGSQQVSDTIFGSFLEPIGNSINNGLVAEILVNRSLESGLWNRTNLEAMFTDQPELVDSTNETGIPLPWESLNTAAGNRFELHVGDAANSWQSLEIMGQPDQFTGIRQKVYLPVQRELGYNVSLYAKHIDGPSQITVLFRDRVTGKVFAESSIDATGVDWKKYTRISHAQRGRERIFLA